MKKILLLSLIVALAPLANADHHEHHGHHSGKAHVHGEGKLQIAGEGRALHIELELPAHDVVGFETHPKTKAQKNKVRQAAKKLADAKEAFIFNSEAQCMPERQGVVESELLKGHDHHGHHEGEHTEFKVEYRFQCQNIKKLEYVRFNLFRRFKSLSKVRAEAALAQGSFVQELTQRKTRMKLIKE